MATNALSRPRGDEAGSSEPSKLGAFEALALAGVEATLKYQPGVIAVLTWVH
jgi:hypothetical protein